MLDRGESVLHIVTILCFLGFAMPCGCCRTAASSNCVEPSADVHGPKIAANISVISQPAGRYLHCSIENHGDRKIILGDGMFVTWHIESRLAGYHSGHWDTTHISRSHYMILQPIPASRLDSGYRIDTDQLRWDLSLDALQERLNSSDSGKLTVSIDGLCSTDLCPRGYSVELALDLPLVAGSGAKKEFFVPKDVPFSASEEFSRADAKPSPLEGATRPASGTSVDDVLAKLKAKRDKESGIKETGKGDIGK